MCIPLKKRASILALSLPLILSALLLGLPCARLAAVDLSLRSGGFAFVPMGDGNEAADGNERFGAGGGGSLGFEVDLSSVWPNRLGLSYVVGAEAGMLMSALQTDDRPNAGFFSLGGVAGLYFFPLSRLLVRVDGALGAHLAVLDEARSPADLFWRAGGEVGFRFTPGFTLAAAGGWRQFSAGGGLANSGVYAGLTAQMTFRTGGGWRDGATATLDQPEAAFPAFMQLYQTHELGTVSIRNAGNAEMRNVRVYFRAGGYTASEFPSGSVPMIPRGRVANVPLLADFSPEILHFTDTGRIMGELVIRYSFLGRQRESVRAVTVATPNRNRITPGDASALAAFVSPTSPETLEFARFVSGMHRANRRAGHNANMQYAVWLLEGLRASNIRLGETHMGADEAQFPAETLLFTTGTSRDLALLFATALEGVGIESAFIGTPDELLVAVNLGIGPAAAETLFYDFGRILIIDGETWLPLSMGAFNYGFMAAWSAGIDVLNRVFDEGADADFVIVGEAWAFFPLAPLPRLGRGVAGTNTEAMIREANNAMRQYIDRDILPIIRRTMPGAAGNPALQNRLGMLHVRAGNMAEGRAAYERAAALGSVAAMTNRGNLALTEGGGVAAERWFGQALQRNSGNAAALRGMERVQGSR